MHDFAHATTRSWTAVLIDLDGTLVDATDGTAAAIPGMAGVINDLRAAGIPVAIVSSTPQLDAAAMLQGLDLVEEVELVESATGSNGPAVTAALEQLGLASGRSGSVLVADRGSDIAAATAAGIPTILVEWGLGSPAEADGALAVVHSVDQLRALLLG